MVNDQDFRHRVAFYIGPGGPKCPCCNTGNSKVRLKKMRAAKRSERQLARESIARQLQDREVEIHEDERVQEVRQRGKKIGKSTNYREMILSEMWANGDTWSTDVEHNITPQQFEQVFTPENRFPEMTGWILWTSERIYFPATCQDQGGFWVESVPRNPCSETFLSS